MSDVRLLGARELREIAARLDLRPTKKLGQNFVHDPATVRRIAKLANLYPEQHVLEVGPGLGSLTLALLEAGAAVTAIEIDPLLAQQLPATVTSHAPGRPFRVLNADALLIDSPTRLSEAVNAPAVQNPAPFKKAPTALVANLPYNVAVPILLHLLATFPNLESVLVMVQSEVAKRLCALPGSRVYGVPSAKLAWYGQARIAGAVSRSVFWPVPGVDSELVSLQVEKCFPESLRESVFAAIDRAFSARRKTLRALFRGDAAATASGIDLSRRGETLNIAQFVQLVGGTVPAEPRTAIATAPGKVNLYLRSGLPDERGYHPLTTVFAEVNLRETVRVRLGETTGFTVQITADRIEVPEELSRLPVEKNLAVRALRTLGISGANIEITKQVPVAGGMAGGSADAAATLLAGSKLMSLPEDADTLHNLARGLGADVPFGLLGGIAIGAGYGDKLRKLRDSSPYHWVFVVTERGLSTPAVFSELDRMRTAGEVSNPGFGWDGEPTELIAALTDGNPERLAPLLHNDLQAAAVSLRPELADTLSAVEAAGALRAIVSGSGPTVAGLCRDEEQAVKVAEVLRQQGYRVISA
ncbi:MAG: 4-(cytidine 5'-diphospho)-2-C-methyl-D-erythritol kinase [Varibaculum sp.]|nr:4-(cytidine 5'-diphospho)-2-C-methyl-D-erythritol kinase [Varibaculum sp.]